MGVRDPEVRKFRKNNSKLFRPRFNFGAKQKSELKNFVLEGHPTVGVSNSCQGCSIIHNYCSNHMITNQRFKRCLFSSMQIACITFLLFEKVLSDISTHSPNCLGCYVNSLLYFTVVPRSIWRNKLSQWGSEIKSRQMFHTSRYFEDVNL